MKIIAKEVTNINSNEITFIMVNESKETVIPCNKIKSIYWILRVDEYPYIEIELF
jgi:hypothetical protein